MIKKFLYIFSFIYTSSGLIVYSQTQPIFVGPATVCVGATNTYTVQAGMHDYKWTVLSGTITAGGDTGSSSVTVYWNQGTGSFYVAVNFTDGSGKRNGAGSDTIYNVSVTSFPTANAGNAMADICQGATSGQLGGSFGGSATGAIWSDGGAGGSFANNSGSTPGITTYTASATSGTPVTLTLTTTGAACTASDTKQINVRPLPTVNVGGALVPICQGATSGALGGSFGGSATAAIWSDGLAGGSFNNNSGNTPGAATYTSSATSGTPVTLTLTTSGGICGTVSNTKNITVNPMPIVDAGTAMAAICQGTTSGALDGTFAGGATAAVWSDGSGGGSFANNGGLTPNTATFTASATSGTPITLTLTTSGGSCGTATTSKVITVNPSPTVNVGSGMAAICQGGTSGPLGGSFGGSAVNAVWTDGGSGGTFSNNGGTTPGTATYTASASSATPVTLTLTTSGGTCGTAFASKLITVNPLPTITTSSRADSVCFSTLAQNTFLTYTGTTNSPTKYLITWNAAAIAAGLVNVGSTNLPASPVTIPVAAGVTAGTYNGKINVTNVNGCESTGNTFLFPVNALPVPSLNGTTPVCNNSTYTYTTDPGMTDYVWTVSTGGTITAGGGINDYSVTINWKTAGPQSVSVNYTNNNGCSATLASVLNVTVNALPTPNLTGPATSCVGSIGNKYITDAGQSNYVWVVSPGGTVTSGGKSTNDTVTISWETDGSQYVSVNYTNAGGCTAVNPKNYPVTVNGLPTPSISGPASLCQGSKNNLYTTTPGQTNYVWTISSGGKITSGGGNVDSVKVTWNTAGNQTVKLTYTSNGCTAASPAVDDITVHALPKPVVTSTASAVCEGTTGSIYSTSSGESNYLWIVSSGGSITSGGDNSENSVTVTWNTPGTQTVMLNYTDENQCSAANDTSFYVTVYALPVPSVSGPQAVCNGSSGVVYSTTPGENNYIWSVSSGGVITSGENSNSVNITWNTPGNQTVSLIYTNSHGCTSSSPVSYQVTVDSLPDPQIYGPSTACAGPAPYTYTTATGQSNYLWSVSSGGIITSGGGVNDNSVGVKWINATVNTVSLNYTNTNSCTANSPTTINVTVNSLPVVKITDLSSAYSLNSVRVLLQATPTGGYYTDTDHGITQNGDNYYFDTNYAGATTSDTVVYHYTNPSTGCSNTDTVFVAVLSSDAYILGLRSQLTYCNFDNPFTITGANVFHTIGSFAISGGVGLKDNHDTAIITPSVIPGGVYTITYTYSNTVTNVSISQNISVEIIDPATIEGIAPGTYCNNTQMIEINGNYPTGTFSGMGVIEKNNLTYFEPKLTYPGKNKIYYKYETSYGCVTSDSLNITISPIPTSQFSVANSCWNGDSTKFINTSTPKDSITSWTWNFGDINSFFNSSNYFQPEHEYPSPGNYTVSLVARNILNCTDTITRKIHLGDIPSVGFTWDKNCYSKNIQVDFTNQSISTDTISTYYWTIIDSVHRTTTTSKSENNLQTFSSAGSYDVKLKLSTNNGCTDSLTQVFHLQPIYALRDSSYNAGFTTSNSYWFGNQYKTPNWYWGIPTGSVITSPGNNVIFTSLGNPHQKQQLILTGPCFDFTNFTRPYIDMSVNYNTQPGIEGAVLQYSQNGTGQWHTIGKVGSGINWYDTSAIASLPGNQELGWTGNSSGWIDARNKLDSLLQYSIVQLRMVYGSSASAKGDGFAVNNISINQRTKTTLYEQFTNYSVPFANFGNNQLDSVISLDSIDACSIQYHTLFPGTDSLAEENKSDPGSRVALYGIDEVPTCYLDGGIDKYNFSTLKPNINDLNIRSLNNSLFKLNITVDNNNGTIQGVVNISAQNNLSNQTVALYVAVVENIQVQTGNNIIKFKNVLRKLVPFNQSGASNPYYILQSFWIKDQVIPTSFSWSPGKAFNIDNLKIVAFIQDQSSYEVYQVAELPVDYINGINQTTSEANKLSLTLFPNPVSNIATINFGTSIPTNTYKLQLSDSQGKLVCSYNLAKGTSVFELDVTGLPNGLYIITVYDFDQVPHTLKMIVVH